MYNSTVKNCRKPVSPLASSLLATNSFCKQLDGIWPFAAIGKFQRCQALLIFKQRISAFINQQFDSLGAAVHAGHHEWRGAVG